MKAIDYSQLLGNSGCHERPHSHLRTLGPRRRHPPHFNNMRASSSQLRCRHRLAPQLQRQHAFPHRGPLGLIERRAHLRHSRD
eukprot:4983-Chlamydomonas_euryale.AAC.3